VCEYRSRSVAALGRTPTHFGRLQLFYCDRPLWGDDSLPLFIFSVFLFAFFCFSASFDVPWAIVVRGGIWGSIWPSGRLPLSRFLSLAPLRPWLRRVCRICLGISLVFVRQRQRRRRSRSPFRPSLAPRHVRQHSQAVTAQHASCVSRPATFSLSP
jgi:hypothetical protein